MKIYFVCDTSDNSNWGCRATTNALRKMIEKCGAEISHTLYLKRMSTMDGYVQRRSRTIGYAISFAIQLAHKRPDIPFHATLNFIEQIWNKFTDIGDTVPKYFFEFEPFAKKVLAGNILKPERQALEGCDLVVINGEGGIYDRQRKGRMMLFIAYLAKQYFRKPCILINHTADIHDPVMAEMAAHVYPLLDDVIFREPFSANACSSFLMGKINIMGADAAFTYRPLTDPVWAPIAAREGYFSIWPDSSVGFDPRKPYVCVGGSSIYLRPDRPAYDPVPGFINLCRMLQEQVAPVVLTAPCYTDERIFRPIAQKLNLPLIALSTPTQQAVDILGNARAYVSGRWHPSIFALTGGTPIVTLTANTYKTQALVKQIGLDAPTFDALKLREEAEQIIELTCSYVEQGNSLREKLRQRAEELSKLAWENVRYLQHW